MSTLLGIGNWIDLGILVLKETRLAVARRRSGAALAAAVASVVFAASACAAEIEPLHVQLSIQGGAFEGENCEGGEWSVSWRGELPAETNDITDLITSYSSFDTTNERNRVDPPAQVTTKPVICRDDDGAIVLQTSMGGGTRAIRGVASLNDNPSVPSPFFDFAVEDAGTCRVKTPLMTQTFETSLLQIRAPNLSTLNPAFSVTREELEKGFTKRYTIEGPVVASAFMCMGTPVERGELIVSYKQDARRPTIGLAGCAHVERGASATVTAKVDPPGGSVRFTSEPASTLSLKPSAASVTVTGATPGRAKLTGEYTYNGKTATATLPASSIELISVNSGAAIPKLGLLGLNGRTSSKVYSFPIQSNPVDAGDLLIFTVENEALASVVTNRNSIGIQPVREGRTRIQAKTACGAPIGPPIDIEIATCDPEVRGEFVRLQEQLQRREQDIVRRITRLTADSEFQRAATEIKDNTINLAVKTSELIAATLTGSQATAVRNGTATAASLRQIETAQNIWTVSGIITDARNGAINSAAVSTYALYLDSWSASALKAAIDSGLAAQQFGQDLGTLVGVAEQLEQLTTQHDEARRELYRVTDRLHRCDKLPPPPPLPPKKDPPRPPQPQPQPPEQELPTDPTPEPPPDPIETQPTPEQPPSPPGPVDPPRRPGGASLCVREVDEPVESRQLRDVLTAASSYQSMLTQTGEALREFQAVAAELQRLNALPDPERANGVAALGPRYDAAVQAFFRIGEASRAHEEEFALCTDTWADTVKRIRTQY
ncbi:MAG: hypothetical protein ACREV5_17085 [Steroidobacter sp.]